MNISPVSVFSFCRRKIPVYAVDSKGNYQRYNSKTEAAEKLNITTADVNRASIKRFHKAKGYMFIPASDVEVVSDNGEIAVYKQKMDEIIAYKTLNREIYAIDKNGNYKKFPSQAEASKQLGIERRAISSAISGNNRTAQGYFFTYADKIESKDNNGNAVVDDEKIKELICDKPLHPIYAIDKQGNFKKFSNQFEAAQNLGISRQRISQVLSSATSSCGGYYIVPADEIETKNEEGKVSIDKTKIENLLAEKRILARYRSAGTVKKIYAIDSNGNYRKFDSRQIASETLGIPVSTIGNVVIGCQKTSHGLIFVNASEIEKVGENHEFVVDDEKLKKILKQRFPKTIFLS